MVKVNLHGDYYSDFRQILSGKPEISREIEIKIKWFKKNPDDTRLRNHAFKNILKGKWAFNITDDIRIVYEWMGKNTVRFLSIGGHNQVYPKSSRKNQSFIKSP